MTTPNKITALEMTDAVRRAFGPAYYAMKFRGKFIVGRRVTEMFISNAPSGKTWDAALINASIYFSGKRAGKPCRYWKQISGKPCGKCFACQDESERTGLAC